MRVSIGFPERKGIVFGVLLAAAAASVACGNGFSSSCEQDRSCEGLASGGRDGGTDQNASGNGATASSEGDAGSAGTASGAGPAMGGAGSTPLDEGGAGGGGAGADPDGGAGAGGAGGGSSEAGGSGGSPAITSGPGSPCTQSGLLACAGVHQKILMICDGSEWTIHETCAFDENCNTAAPTCAPILPECEGKEPGYASCVEGEVAVCGVDLVTASRESCEGRCVDAVCQEPTCGDGIVQSSLGETCDDENDDDTDDCPTNCRTAECGDGFVHVDEACDDGNDIETDACLSTCEAASCGDGYVWEGAEQCEPSLSPEDCRSVCKWIWDPAGGCALQRVTGIVKCWGSNSRGQLGLGDKEHRGDDPDEMGENLPPVDLGTGRRAVYLAAHRRHRCAILDDGGLKCWGENGLGQCGAGHKNDIGDDPGEMGDDLAPVDLGNRQAVSVSVGGAHTCAVLNDGKVKCWGYNQWGQLGIGNNEDQGDEAGEMGTSLNDADLGKNRIAFDVVTGSDHTCALLDNAQVKCWGSNQWGQLGRTSSVQDDTYEIGDGPNEMGDNLPYVPVDVGTSGVASIHAGSTHTCVVGSGRVKCWGKNSNAQLGQGDWDDRGYTEAEVSSLNDVKLGVGAVATSLSLGALHTCARLSDGAVKCFGSNYYAQLGRGDTVQSWGYDPAHMGPGLVPVDVGTGRTIVDIQAIYYTSCALLDDGTIRCWGDSSSYDYLEGALGLGNTEYRGFSPDEMGDNLPPLELD